MDLPQKIKYYRTKILNIKQDELAAMLEISTSTVKNLEAGVSKPNVHHLSMLSLLFSVTTDYLLFDNHPLELSPIPLDNESYDLLKRLILRLKKKDEHTRF